jgi:SRSO17 transposase
MIARAIAAPVLFKWVAGDTVYCVGDIEKQLRKTGKDYAGSAALTCFDPGASDDRLPARPPTSPRRGQRPTENASRQEPGTKSPRLHDWCYLELTDLDAEEFNSVNQGL